MTTETVQSTQSQAVPRAPSTLERWFPIATWLPKYDWSKNLTLDLIAAVSVAALLIPESMGYASVAGVPVQIGLYAASAGPDRLRHVWWIEAAGVCRSRVYSSHVGQRGRSSLRRRPGAPR